MVNIAGLDKAQVLKALHDGTQPMGMGILHARDHVPVEEFERLIGLSIKAGMQHPYQVGPGDEVAKEFTSDADYFSLASTYEGRLYFDYVFGRPLKVDISGDELDERLYDRDAGEGAAARVIADLRERLVV